MLRGLTTGILLLASLSLVDRYANAIELPYVPPPEDVLAGEGVTAQPVLLFAAAPSGNIIDRTAWTVTCDSFQPGYECRNAIDGDENTFWHTQYDPTNAPLPHTFTIDMKTTYYVNGVTYLP
jgi:hypothetical protein